jgi:hypothetical protein
MLKNPKSTKEILRRHNSKAISRQVCPALLLDIPAGTWQRALVEESGMIITQMGMHNRSEMVTLCHYDK